MKFLFHTFIFLCISFGINAQSIVNTKHNLSVTGPGSVKATGETEICLFCHTAHNSKPQSPLWNRNDPGSTYSPYTSSTMKALPGQPSGSSILCLSCHDGTVALGSVLSRSSTISFANTSNMPAGPSNLSTDLRNDHPVSFTYDAALVAANGHLNNPATLGSQITLENNKLQCTSCHDPHKNLYTDFLVASSQYSNICIACHAQPSWSTSSHKTSTKTWNHNAPNPWPFTPWTTVAENACESCHNPHNSGGLKRLLKYPAEEDNCLDCHNGNVATKNIQAEFAKAYKHNVYGYTGTHDPTEASAVSTRHVECVDCHSAHEANATTASAPAVRGPNKGVKGINQSGVAVNPVTNEYEICYRCHSDNPVTGPTTPRRIIQNNVRLEFALNNPSFHPIAGPGVNASVPSLISPLSRTSIIYCTDCHASNGAGSPAGPHGSIYPQILKSQYILTDNTNYNVSNFQLCYNCHSSTSIMNDISFKEHSKHISGERASCNTCHDSHGISSLQGTAANNSNLINFNTNYVTPSSSGILRFDDLGNNKGRCYLRCHGENHNPLSY